MPDREFNYARQFTPREERDRMLIVCEGETEEKYFDNFPKGKLEIICFNAKGGSILKTVQKAIKEKEKHFYHKVWCVVDRDRGHNNTPQVLKDAIEAAQENKIELAYSNKCFELWFLLHYELPDTNLSKLAYFKKLEELTEQTYEKPAEHMYYLLNESRSNAVDNAKQLAWRYSNRNWWDNDPYTTVHWLVEEIEEYLKGY